MTNHPSLPPMSDQWYQEAVSDALKSLTTAAPGNKKFRVTVLSAALMGASGSLMPDDSLDTAKRKPDPNAVEFPDSVKVAMTNQKSKKENSVRMRSSRAYESLCLESPVESSVRKAKVFWSGELQQKSTSALSFSPNDSTGSGFDWLSCHVGYGSQPCDTSSEEDECDVSYANCENISFFQTSQSGPIPSSNNITNMKPRKSGPKVPLTVDDPNVSPRRRWRPSLDAITEAEAINIRALAEQRLGGRAKYRLQKSRQEVKVQ